RLRSRRPFSVVTATSRPSGDGSIAELPPSELWSRKRDISMSSLTENILFCASASTATEMPRLAIITNLATQPIQGCDTRPLTLFEWTFGNEHRCTVSCDNLLFPCGEKALFNFEG